MMTSFVRTPATRTATANTCKYSTAVNRLHLGVSWGALGVTAEGGARLSQAHGRFDERRLAHLVPIKECRVVVTPLLNGDLACDLPESCAGRAYPDENHGEEEIVRDPRQREHQRGD